MTHLLYLHYRNSTEDSWTAVPSLASAFPALTGDYAGALPIGAASFETAPEAVTPFSWDTTSDGYLIMHVMCAPIPLTLESAIMAFLINYKTATYHEAKFVRYGLGGFVSASLSLVTAQEEDGMLLLQFRLAAAIADTLTNT